MPDDISVQILSQASENIQKLFDISTRIDERVKAIKEYQEEMSSKIDSVNREYHEVVRKVAVLEVHNNSSGLSSLSIKLDESDKRINELEKRLIAVESATNTHTDRWKQIFSFIVQLLWICVAAWLLLKAGLQSPPVP